MRFRTKWRGLMRESNLVPGIVRVRKIRGRLVGAVNVGGRIYVFGGRCPHAGRSLDGSEANSQGIIVCPGHGFRYSLGFQPCSINAMPLTQLPFRVREGIIEVDRDALRSRRPAVTVGSDRANHAAVSRRG